MFDEAQILVLEGPLSQGISDVLAEEGWPVTRATDAGQICSEAEGAALVVLDVLAPGTGLETIQGLEQSVTAPVLAIVPALDTGERVAAIRAPFQPERLLQQVQELLAEPPPGVVRIGDLAIDLEVWQVTLRGRRVDPSLTEFRFLAQLARNVGRTVPYEELLDAVWGYSPQLGNRRVIASCVYRLRQKLEGGASYPAYIANVRGVGYRLRSQQQWEAAIQRGGVMRRVADARRLVYHQIAIKL